jgi:hypothetical protein
MALQTCACTGHSLSGNRAVRIAQHAWFTILGPGTLEFRFAWAMMQAD